MLLVPEIPIAISVLCRKKTDRGGSKEAGVANKLGSLPINLSTPIVPRVRLRAISRSDIVRE
jgi:hypothetical protein